MATDSDVRKFMELLVRAVRDRAIQDCDRGLNPDSVDPTSRHWRDAAVAGTLPSVMIPDVVDSVIYFLLNAIDRSELDLRFVADDGRTIDLRDTTYVAGMAGEYVGDSDWLPSFSKERYWRDDTPFDLERALGGDGEFEDGEEN